MNKDRSLYSLEEQRPLAILAKRVKTILLRPMAFLSFVLCPLSFVISSCNPDAPWTTKEVTISVNVTTVSAGFVECSFDTDKNAYYLIGIQEAKVGVDPMTQQKQFMQLAIDQADREYLDWREWLLRESEFNIAPFASHMLNYGSVNHFFTGLVPGTTYWIYAFVVDPDKKKPAGKLYMTTVTTKVESEMAIHFDYRIKGYWDYIYPLDSMGRIYDHFPYIATTRDSAELAEHDSVYTHLDADIYFSTWVVERFIDPDWATVLYGVKATENNAWDSYLEFQEGHTYYTLISGFDGGFKQYCIYKFKWTGDDCDLYFVDTDSANIVNTISNE